MNLSMGIFKIDLGWINMMVNDQIKDVKDLDQYKLIIEGLTCL